MAPPCRSGAARPRGRGAPTVRAAPRSAAVPRVGTGRGDEPCWWKPRSRRRRRGARDRGRADPRTMPGAASGCRGGPARWRAPSFFARDPVAVEEAPQRAEANRRAALGQPRLQLDQGDVVLGLDRTEEEAGMRLDPRRAAPREE